MSYIQVGIKLLEEEIIEGFIGSRLEQTTRLEICFMILAQASQAEINA